MPTVPWLFAVNLRPRPSKVKVKVKIRQLTWLWMTWELTLHCCLKSVFCYLLLLSLLNDWLQLNSHTTCNSRTLHPSLIGCWLSHDLLTLLYTVLPFPSGLRFSSGLIVFSRWVRPPEEIKWIFKCTSTWLSSTALCYSYLLLPPNTVLQRHAQYCVNVISIFHLSFTELVVAKLSAKCVSCFSACYQHKCQTKV